MLTVTEKDFMNLKEIKYMTIPRKLLGKQSDDMIYGFLISLTKEGTLYERKVYSLVDMLGKIGGLQEALDILAVLVLYIV